MRFCIGNIDIRLCNTKCLVSSGAQRQTHQSLSNIKEIVFFYDISENLRRHLIEVVDQEA